MDRRFFLFQIEDELHAEPQGEYSTLEEAMVELHRRALIPWNEKPNCAPCVNWNNCGRNYEVIEYDTTTNPWTEIRRIGGFEISKSGVIWNTD